MSYKKRLTDLRDGGKVRELVASDYTRTPFTLNNTTWTQIATETEFVRFSTIFQFQDTTGADIIEVNLSDDGVAPIYLNSAQGLTELNGIFANYSGDIYARIKAGGATSINGVIWTA